MGLGRRSEFRMATGLEASRGTIRTGLPIATDVTVIDTISINKESDAVTEMDKRHGGLWENSGKKDGCYYV